MADDAPDTLRAQLDLHRRRLAHALEQQRVLGVYTPFYVAEEIRACRDAIAQCKAALRALGHAADDASGDDPTLAERTTVPPFAAVQHGDSVGGDKIGGDKVLGDKHEHHFHMPPPPDDPAEARRIAQALLAAEEYCGEMQLRYGTMRIIGMPEPVALADIFTDVDLLDKPSAWRRHNIEELQGRAQPQSEPDQKREERHDALTLIQHHKHLMILGKPGAGKTTLMKHLVLQCTTGNLDAVPIFVGLKDWSDSGLALMPFLSRQFEICSFPDALPFIEHILTEGQALVLFDGLDEVNLEHGMRQGITREVRDFAEKYSRSFCVITCRTAASEYQFEHFTYCELADFTIEQMQVFVTQWFQRDKTKCAAFLEEFAKDEHKRLRDMGRTPLLLALLCIAFEKRMYFPLRQDELYKEAFEALLKNWDAERYIERANVYRKLSLSHKRRLLAQIAFDTFSSGDLFMQQRNLEKRINLYLSSFPLSDTDEEIDAKSILKAIEAQHGLLVERAQGIYSFSHLTFHEYFAACYVVEHPSKEMFRSVVEHAHDTRWREVLLLVSSMLDDENAEVFFDAFDAALRAMLQCDPALISLFQWMERKAQQLILAQQVATRGAYLVLALITTAIITLHDILPRARAHAEEQDDHDIHYSYVLDDGIDNSIAAARDLALTLAHDGEIVLQDDINFSFAFKTDHEDSSIRVFIDFSISDAFVLTFARIHTLVLTWTGKSQQRGIETLQNDSIWTGMLLGIQLAPWKYVLSRHPFTGDLRGPGYDELLSIWHQQTINASPNLRAALTELTLPSENTSVDHWQHFSAKLQAALAAHQDIVQLWKLNVSQLKCLADYLEASKRMLECLDLAAVADRDAIRNRLLLPPDD